MARKLLGRSSTLGIVLLAGLALSCESTYYSMWEKLGKEKRDLLRSNVESVHDEQEEAAEQFESALDRLRSLYGIDGGELENAYEDLKRDADRAGDRADDIRDRIATIDDVADDLFVEWEAELAQISSASMRAESRRKLDETRRDFATLSTSLHKAEAAMDPVLVQLNDHVLFLKHNLNAAAIGGLGVEVEAIEGDVGALLADLQSSIAEAERFLRRMPH